jgi:hypothetical protein
MELLKEIAPRVTRVAILYNPTTAPYAEIYIKPFKAAAASLGVEANTAPVRDTSELEIIVGAHARAPNGRLIAMPDAFMNTHRERVVSLAAHHHLPAVYAGYQFGRVSATAVGIAHAPTNVNPHVATVGPPRLLQSLHEGREAGRCFRTVRGHGHEHPDAPRPLALLRACRQRPSDARTAEQRHELPSSHRLFTLIRRRKDPTILAVGKALRIAGKIGC